ncbi:MAG: hypothetical protein WEB19_00895 [Acidimicrobiia bacterium]
MRWLRIVLPFIPFAALLLVSATAVSYMHSFEVQVQATPGPRVYASGALPHGAVWKERGDGSGPLAPDWSPALGRTVGVHTAGDLAVIDGRREAGGVRLAVSFANGAALAADYAYLVLPVLVYGRDGGGEWALVRESYLALEDGGVTVTLPGAHDWYAVTIGRGGSIRAKAAVEDEAHTLSPRFLVTSRRGG